jgi:hypothetical protein
VPPGAGPAPPVQREATERQQLQRAIEEAANDRAALVKNLEAFLKKFPESTERPQIYRALVESSLQLRDFPRALDYSEKLVSLKPDDVSNTVLSISIVTATFPGTVARSSTAAAFLNMSITPRRRTSRRVFPSKSGKTRRKKINLRFFWFAVTFTRN